MARRRNRANRSSTVSTGTTDWGGGTQLERTVSTKGSIMGNKFEELPLFLTPQQLADVTGEHVNSIRRGITEGRIPADKVNGRWRICRDAIFANTKEGLLFGKKVEE